MTLAAIAAIALIGGSFAPILAGVPKSLPDRQPLAFVTDVLLIACGAGLLVRRTAEAAAFLLLVYLIIWTVLFKVPFIVRQPLVEVSYQTCGENLVLIAAAWALYVEFATRRGFPAGAVGLRVARLLYGLALIAFGFSHFAYLNLTAPLVPPWLPGPVFWAYLTGAIYVATGIALVTGFLARFGAFLAAIQITLITVLVWGPVVLAGHVGGSDWQETAVSWALTAAAWVVAASFGPGRWFTRAAFGGFGLRRLARR
jgi:uncharacterized membrane protein